MSETTLPAGDLRERARRMLESHWREPGFCVPNDLSYPWQWLWDSCFHAICWAHLGEGGRAVTELTTALARQADDGFVPHMTYWQRAGTHTDFWQRHRHDHGTSAITQPPMYGHALAELVRLGIAVPDELVERARRGLAFLDRTRHRPGVGVVVVHPWETGCDDSPRWDAWCPQPWTSGGWKEQKGELVGALVRRPVSGSPVGSSRCEVASAGFNALVAFNRAELATVTGDSPGPEGVRLLDEAWDPDAGTWVDRVVVGPVGSTRVRTLDALLPVLVSGRAAAVDAAFAQVIDDRAFGGRFGPAGVHRDEPAFDPVAYWRGPAWPQLTYLLWVAATWRGRTADADRLAGRLRAGAEQSGFAEYWHPDTGAGLGAVPQSWTALAVVVGGGRQARE